ncbi:MAG: IMP cyclohydrolase [Lentisphaeria bacterium]|nr:IMP cyclohydrolase [Lentisphaeria bacterium]
MTSEKLSRSTYLSRNVGEFAPTAELFGMAYEKVDDLRYGTNPHQTAAYYKPIGVNSVIGDMEVLKTGKGGLSQTNLEDISYALNICKFFPEPACACMKHVNPSGAAVAVPGDSLVDVYKKARDCDPRAAFGSAVAFNVPLDVATAREIMTSFVECVVAPEYEDGVLDVFTDRETYRINKSIRILKCGDLADLPKYVGDDVSGYQTMKVLADGCVVVADPLMTHVRSVADLPAAVGVSKDLGEVKSEVEATPQQLNDLLVAWYMNVNVRSNGVVIVKNGGALAVGTGEQDRVGAVEQAIAKYESKYKGPEETIEGAAMASDGFFPFPDAVEVAAAVGVKAIVAPVGSIKDAVVIARANELGVALRHAPERVFSHH